MLTAKEARQKIMNSAARRKQICLSAIEGAIDKAVEEGKFQTNVDCPLFDGERFDLEDQLRDLGYKVSECGVMLNGGANICINWDEDNGEEG
jgi:hypothetical protein